MHCFTEFPNTNFSPKIRRAPEIFTCTPLGALCPSYPTHWAGWPMAHCTMVPLDQVHARFRSFSLYAFVNRCNMKNTRKSRTAPFFSLGIAWGHYARGAQHTGHHGCCHAWNRYKMKIFHKGYYQRFLALFHRISKHEFFTQNKAGTRNFHLHTIGGTMPQLSNTLGRVAHGALHNSATWSGTRSFSGFFTICLCK